MSRTLARNARLYITAAGLLRGSYQRVDETLPAFVEALREDPELLWALAADFLERVARDVS
jgi:hypothetical protein